MEEPRVLGPGLATALSTYRRRRRLAALLTGGGAALLALGLALPVLMLIDGWARADDGWRWVAWAACALAALLVFRWGAGGAWRLGSAVAVARALEARAAIGGALLSTGVSLAEAPPRAASPWMIARTIALADQTAAALRDWPILVPVPRLWPAIGSGVLLLCLAAMLQPDTRPWLTRAWWPGSYTARPGALVIEALPGDGAVPTGESPRLSAVIRDLNGTLCNVTAATALIAWTDGRQEERPLEPTPNSTGLWQTTLPPVTCALTWRIRADRDGDGRWDGESDRHALRVTAGFMPGDVLLLLTPPAYSRLAPILCEGGDAACLPGTEIAIEATVAAGGPRLVAATIMLEADAVSSSETPGASSQEREIPARIVGPTVHAQWTARTSTRWGLRLIAAGGHEELPAHRWRITVTPDLLPAVHVASAPSTLAADGCAIVQLTAEDDVGLTTAGLEIRRNHANGEMLALLPLMEGDAQVGDRQCHADLLLDGAALGLAVGDTLALVPVAGDRAGQTVRGTPAIVLVAADGSGGWLRLATRLRVVVAACDIALGTLPGVRSAAEQAGSDAPARRLALARQTAWSTALATAAASWPPTTTDSTADSKNERAGRTAEAECRAAVAELAKWAQAHATKPLVTAAAELADMRGELALRAAHAAAAAAACEAATATAAAIRHAQALHTDLLWRNHPEPGLSAQFSADADDAPAVRTIIDMPEFTNRDVPGLGLTGFRVHYRGLLLIPAAGAELVVTADDGVRLNIAGNDLLPAAAWADQAPTAWRTTRLPGGWQPLDLLYRQGSGGSALHLAWGDGRPVTRDDLRSYRAPPELAMTDTTASNARSVALAETLERLGLTASTTPWTHDILDHSLTQAHAVVSAAEAAAAAAEAKVAAAQRPLLSELSPSREPPPPEASSAAEPRTARLRHGSDQARSDLALAAAALAVELHDTAPAASLPADSAEALERAARDLRPPADQQLVKAAHELVALATPTASSVADGGLIDPTRENAARRLAAALERLTTAAARMERINAQPREAPPSAPPSATATVLPTPVTDAGRTRARLAIPTIDESGITGFRIDQQQAIRAYLSRLRRQQREAQ